MSYRLHRGGLYKVRHHLRGHPWSFTLSAEPEWPRIDETSGSRVNNAELELKLNADVELVKNRLYFGSNILYEPQGTHDPGGVGAGWKKESKVGISGALCRLRFR
jgi:hypothetical protein